MKCFGWKELKIFWLTLSYQLITFKNGPKVVFQEMSSKLYLPGEKVKADPCLVIGEQPWHQRNDIDKTNSAEATQHCLSTINAQ